MTPLQRSELRRAWPGVVAVSVAVAWLAICFLRPAWVFSLTVFFLTSAWPDMPQPTRPFAERVFENDPRAAALGNAIEAGDLDEMRRLWIAGADMKARGRAGITMGHIALRARANAPEVMDFVLNAGADPFARNDWGDELPALAVYRKPENPAVVEVLLHHGVPADHRNDTTPLLHGAVHVGNHVIAELLLAHGADIEAEDLPHNGTGLVEAFAYRFPFYDCAEFYLLHGASTTHRTFADREHPSVLPIEYWCSRLQDGGDLSDAANRQNAREFLDRLALKGIRLDCKFPAPPAPSSASSTPTR